MAGAARCVGAQVVHASSGSAPRLRRHDPPARACLRHSTIASLALSLACCRLVAEIKDGVRVEAVELFLASRYHRRAHRWRQRCRQRAAPLGWCNFEEECRLLEKMDQSLRKNCVARPSRVDAILEEALYRHAVDGVTALRHRR